MINHCDARLTNELAETLRYLYTQLFYRKAGREK